MTLDTRARVLSPFRAVYERLLATQGHSAWWPGESPFEICLGAILVQNTAWPNAARALDGLRAQDLLRFEKLNALSAEAMAPLLRPAGCFSVKAKRVRAFLDFVGNELGGDCRRMSALAPRVLRERLLRVPGIGRETADCMVLYAAGLPSFVVDAYTRRVFSRLSLLAGDESYDAIQAVFEAALPRDAALFNDYHAQIVRLAQASCRVRPRCPGCPLLALCPTGTRLVAEAPVADPPRARRRARPSVQAGGAS